MNMGLLEFANLKQIAPIADLNAAATTGARVNLADYERLAVILSFNSGLTGPSVIASLRQHNAASGGTSKALAIKTPYYYKAGAATVFTKVEPSVAADSFDLSSVFDTNGGILVFDIAAEDLDGDAGFAFASLDLPDAGVAKLGYGLYLAHDANHKPAYDQAI